MLKDLLIQAAKDSQMDEIHFDMDYFVFNDDDDDEYKADSTYVDDNNQLTCGTTLCLAGRVAFNHNPALLKDKSRDLEYEAYEILKATPEERKELEELFYNNLRINKDNVVQVVEIFCNKGLEAMQKFLSKDITFLDKNA